MTRCGSGQFLLKGSCHCWGVWVFRFADMERGVEIPPALSAKFKSSFAYDTIKDRLPVILASIADTVFRSKSWVKEEYGQEVSEELKNIAGCVSKLRNELQTSKPLIPIEDSRSDAKAWNDYLREVTERDGEEPTWFTSPWLYVECYMYRRVQEAVEQSEHLKTFDVFSEQKKKALTDSSSAILTLLDYLMTIVDDLEKESDLNKETLFKEFMKVALWGNKCDLSISAGQENAQTSCPLDQVNKLQKYVLIDDLDSVWQHISKIDKGRIDIVLDNAGFEFVTDLCLAEFFLSAGFAKTVHLHAKAFPWFVSDVTPSDFDSTKKFFQQSNSLSMNIFCRKWDERLEKGSLILQVHDYWTMPQDYSDMKKYCPDLYAELTSSNLIVFKGDLNYRKLVGDRDWPKTTPFEASLRKFHPAPLCALRTLKADLVTGLKEGQAKEVEKKDKKWMVNGRWAVISFCATTQR